MFAPLADVCFVPRLSEVENSAQWNSATRKRIARDESSDSEDDVPIPALSASARPKIKLRVRPRPTRAAGDIFPPQASTSRGPPQTSDPPAPPSDTPPGSPPETHNPLFSPPPTPPFRTPSRGIKIFEPGISAGSKLATKQRLAKLAVAPNIPRASPMPAAQPTAATTEAAPAEGAMDVDATPTLVPDSASGNADADADATDTISPMLASMASYGEDDFGGEAGGTGLYASDEDRYAGLPRNGDSMNVDFDNGLGDGAEAGEGCVGNDEVLEFLKSIELPSSKASSNDYRPKKPIHARAPIKQWSWTGRLTISVNGGAQTVCENATLTDATEAAPNTPRIGSFVLSTKDLEFPVFYDIYDLLLVLPCCKPPHQFARLTSNGESFQILAAYMSRKELAVLLPALWDDNKILGYLVFVPPTATALADYLGVPPHLRQPGCLIAALLFFPTTAVAPPDGRCPRHFTQKFDRMKPALPFSDARWRKSIRVERPYQLGLRIVRLPADVQRFVYAHASAVWFERVPGAAQDTDTTHLLAILKKSKVGVVPPAEPSAQIVFVHVAALRNIHNLPHLAQRRLRPEVWFCTYGTHPTVPRGRWGFRHIYLLGGVVTFTPEALVRDAWSVLRTIRKIHAHPLWVCYLLPQVIGMAVRLNECRDDELMQPYTGSIPVVLDRIFDAIQDGKVVLVCAPERRTRIEPSSAHTSAKEWACEHAFFRPLTKQAILEFCTKAFDDKYASSLQSTWGTVARNDVLADMRRLQTQPGIVDVYRRFAVLDAAPGPLRYDGEDGIEWCAVGKFDFHDGSQKVEEP
ncbi:hypothetical protein FB451DRAFT_1209241 [Mycena latifolia]|nr:hypothetical protein FB451DRAFT_1209241 [Mycena latifolia]